MFRRNALLRSEDLFRSAFIRACSDTARWDVAVAVASTGNDAARASRAALVAAVREQEWSRALSISTQFTDAVVTAERRKLSNKSKEESSSVSSTSTSSVLDLARVSVGVKRLLQRRAPDGRFKSWQFVQYQQKAIVSLVSDGALRRETCREALDIILSRNGGGGDKNRDHHKKQQQQQQHPRQGDKDRQLRPAIEMSPSMRQTEITEILRDVKKGKHHRHRHESFWKRALELCFPLIGSAVSTSSKDNYSSSSSSSSSSMPKHHHNDSFVHNGHVNGLLSVLIQPNEKQLDLATRVAYHVLLHRDDEQEWKRKNGGISSSEIDTSKWVLPSRFVLTSASALIISELVSLTNDAELAAALLSPKSRAHDAIFPFAAWSACNVLRYSDRWQAALEWHHRSIVDDATAFETKKREKFSKHLKLASCIAWTMVRNGGLPEQEALAVMKDCSDVPGYERVVESIQNWCSRS